MTISNFAHRFFPRELYKRVDSTINLEENPQLCPAKIAVFFKKFKYPVCTNLNLFKFVL